MRKMNRAEFGAIAGPFATAMMLGAPVRVAAAGDQPQYGGELVYIVQTGPPTYDAHREGTFTLIDVAAPHYSTLLRIDPFDKLGIKIVGDLAERWTISDDGKTYTFKLRRGVRFHDGSPMTSRDVKATYDKIIFPPAGVVSLRKGEYVGMQSVDAPDPDTIVFRLKYPMSSLLSSLASPFNWVYKADLLAKDLHFYETNIMGTGPFTFVEHVRGSHWTGKKNPNYWDKRKPYLDGFQAIFVGDPSEQVAAIRGERAMIEFRGFTPQQRDTLVSTMHDKIAVQESPWDCSVVLAINHERKPFDDKRVRRALSLALDRYQGSEVLSKIAILRDVAGVLVPGTPYAASASELQSLAGYSHDIERSRAEAKRLLREAGVPDGFSFTYMNRGIPMPLEPLGIWLIDQWKQIGLNVAQNVVEASKFYGELSKGNFDVASDNNCGYIVDPSLDLFKYQSKDVSDFNFGRYTDRTLDDLYIKQSRTSNVGERKKLIRGFEKRLIDDECHYIMTIQWHRIVPYNAKVHGWTITPSHYLNQQLDTVWLTKT